MQIGIVGLPNVGKSTLFNALLKKQVALAANYPFATIEPNIGIVEVPDPRLDKLAEFVKPEKVLPASVKFVDIAGLVKGASEGEGLGNKFLAHVREVDALVHVVRDFEDPEISRAGSTHPEADREIIETELMLADIQSLEKQLEKEQKFVRSGDKESRERVLVFDKLFQALSSGDLAATVILSDDEMVYAQQANLLTLKPVIYVYNLSEEDFIAGRKDNTDNNIVHLSAKMEADLSILSKEEQEEYKQELGIQVSGLDRVIKRGYDILGLQTYFTAGVKEVRAWTVKKGAKAPEAAGAIHSDFERGFIRAEVIGYDDFISSGIQGSRAKAKDKGLLKVEGKDYEVKDGDVIEFRFNV